MNLAIIGVGHVGLVTGAAFASLGHDVVGFDLDENKMARLQAGELPFHEPALDKLVRDGLETGRLRFTADPADAIGGCHVVFVCVGRPPIGTGDRSLTAVEDTARVIALHADEGVVIVVKSTVPPGTTERVGDVIRDERPDLGFSLAASPEFLREGHAVEDTLNPERVVVGSDDATATATLGSLYEPMIAAGARLIETDARSAELSKLSANAFLALKISFANALARLSESSGADVADVTQIMGADSRIGGSFLGAGLGFGGYCLPKDIATLEQTATRLGYDFPILREVVRLNDEALDTVARAVEDAVWNLEGKTIALLGLAFKANTDDVRSSPGIALARRLLAGGARVIAFDPMAAAEAQRELPEIELGVSAYESVQGAACIVVCTDWPEFRDLDLARLRSTSKAQVIVDGRNLLDPEAVTAAGFRYWGAGRRSIG
jgi:UDPglucose 6-dehydrogenase